MLVLVVVVLPSGSAIIPSGGGEVRGMGPPGVDRAWLYAAAAATAAATARVAIDSTHD